MRQNDKNSISIIIPCYNAEQYLIKTLESAKAQRSDNFEIIAIDDGSTDDTLSILREWKNKNGDVDITIIEKINEGVSIARNTGLRIARGEYCLFLDADDLLPESYVRAMDEFLDEDPDVVTIGRVRMIERLHPMIRPHGEEANPAIIMKRYTYVKRNMGLTSFLFKTKLLRTHGLLFTEGCRYGEDWEFVTKYLVHCKSAIAVDGAYFYRVYPESVSGKATYTQTDAIYAAERTEKYLEDHKHSFAKRYKEYTYHRTVFSVAHRFAKVQRKDLYKRLIKEFPVKDAMRFIRKDKTTRKREKLAAAAYLINPWLFFYGMRLEKKVEGKK